MSLTAALARHTQLICALGEKSTWVMVHPGARVLEPYGLPTSTPVYYFKSQEIEEDVELAKIGQQATSLKQI